MKKILFIAIALVVALGGLGIGYASWTDKVTITGAVNTGIVCLSMKAKGVVDNGCGLAIYNYPGATGNQGDSNWDTFVPGTPELSCPPGFVFSGDTPVCTDKNVAWVEWTSTPPIPNPRDPLGRAQTMTFTIHNAYPYFYADISLWLCNCGTVPVKVYAPVISQDDSIIIEYGDNIGTQWEAGQCKEVSFQVGVTQHENTQDPITGEWTISDPNAPLTAQDSTLTFTIEITGIQWNEYP